MRKLLTLLFTFSGLSVATLGYAANGTVNLTWNTVCDPVVANIAPAPGATGVSLIASVIGNDQTHSGYEVGFLLGDATKQVPDAWRFDAAGCQGSAFIAINHVPPGAASKTCPAFNGAVSVLQIKEYGFVEAPSIYDLTLIKGLLANAYPDGNTTVATQRYFLAQFLFDHTFSVNGPGTPGATCGGFETPMCIALLQGPRSVNEGSTSKYVNFATGQEVPFDISANNFLTVHSQGGCPTTPAQNATWGQIKSQYRQ